jgi:acyl CoA:acetate/3-ketoacid CoA transferase alpha subunit
MQLEQAAALVNSGDSILVGGFGLVGYPELLVDALVLQL